MAGGLGALDAAMGGGRRDEDCLKLQGSYWGGVKFQGYKNSGSGEWGLKSWLHCWGAVDSGS